MLVARILFNMVLCVDSLRPASIALMDNSWIPATMLTAALSLHASWMYGGVKGYLRRQSRARAAAKAAKAAAAEKLHIETETERVALESPADGLATPEESPLVTPYTPSQPSMYIPQHLFPNISIPTMPNLPIPNIPTLSGMAAALPQAKANLDNLNFGLREAKEAIRERWEEQRERISAARFGLRLRRANTDGDQQGILVDDIES
jgi:hypothetical protein